MLVVVRVSGQQAVGALGQLGRDGRLAGVEEGQGEDERHGRLGVQRFGRISPPGVSKDVELSFAEQGQRVLADDGRGDLGIADVGGAAQPCCGIAVSGIPAGCNGVQLLLQAGIAAVQVGLQVRPEQRMDAEPLPPRAVADHE